MAWEGHLEGSIGGGPLSLGAIFKCLKVPCSSVQTILRQVETP